MAELSELRELGERRLSSPLCSLVERPNRVRMPSLDSRRPGLAGFDEATILSLSPERKGIGVCNLRGKELLPSGGSGLLMGAMTKPKPDSTRPIRGTAQTRPAISDELLMRISDSEVGPWGQCLVGP